MTKAERKELNDRYIDLCRVHSDKLWAKAQKEMEELYERATVEYTPHQLGALHRRMKEYANEEYYNDMMMSAY
jgi:hypothetical protein